jgi:hypothetical protein
MTQNQTSFRRGISGNPGGKPQTAEVSALARRYTADWLRGLVGVVRLPVCKENAASIVSAARELREVGYPGLTKAQPESGPASLHLHLLAVTRLADGALSGAAGLLPTLEASPASPDTWDAAEPAADAYLPGDDYLPAVDERMPHEALPLWDAAAAGADDAQIAEDSDGNHGTGEQPGGD